MEKDDNLVRDNENPLLQRNCGGGFFRWYA
jgi:hypothetical protein